MSWSTWPLLKKIVLSCTAPRKSKRHQRDPRVLSHRGIVWCRILHQELHREMPQRAGLFLGRLSNKEDSDLQSFSSHSNLAQGQTPHSSITGTTTIDVSIVAVLPISPRIARNPRSLIQRRTPTRTIRARARSKWCKSDRGELVSLLLQSFPKEHQSCRVLSLSTISPQSYYLILVQLIVL